MNTLTTILRLRNRHIFMLDLVGLLLIPMVAFTLRLDSLNWWPTYDRSLAFFTLATLLIKLPIFYWFGLYCRCWRYATINDLTRVVLAIGLATMLLAGFVLTQGEQLATDGLVIPRTIPIIDGLLTLLVIGGIRVGLRGLYHWQRQLHSNVVDRRVLIVGAGAAGTMVVREIRANPQLKMEPVAFVDDDTTKVNSYIESLPVLGTVADMFKVIGKHQIQQVILATPDASPKRQKEIIAQCKEYNITILNLPGVYELVAGYKTISPLPRVDVNRLLNREPIKTDQTEIATLLNDATVLITGAGGSIGGELCRQNRPIRTGCSRSVGAW